MTSIGRWRGLTALVHDAVKQGSEAVERVQKDYARIPFAVVEKIEPLAVPARAVHAVHDLSVSLTHAAIRIVNTTVAQTIDVVLETVERSKEEREP